MKKSLKIIGLILAILVIGFLILLSYLMVTDYRPEDVEEIEISGNADKKIGKNDNIKILTWNIGYGGLDKDTDFFMDGGDMVFPISKNNVERALTNIKDTIDKINPDISLIQEVDTDSKRTYHIDEVKFLRENLGGDAAFAYNYKVGYVPFPIPPLGKMGSGILTMSDYKIAKSYRYQQPIPHKWPVKLANLKRAFTPSYLPIEGTDKNLVMVNVHLDAYESGSSGRLAQTEQISDFIEGEYQKGNYVIVGGDFNQELRKDYEADIPENLWNPSPFPYDYLTENFDLVFDKNTTTSRLNHKPYDPNDSYECIIDGFIVSKNIKIENIKGQGLGFKDSDHNPVLLEIKLIDKPDLS